MKLVKCILSLYLSIVAIQAATEEEPYDIDWRGRREVSTVELRGRLEITSLNLTNCKFQSLDDIATMTNLKRLNLNSCYEILFEIPKLGALVNLEELNLTGIFSTAVFHNAYHIELPSLEFLTNLSKLERLHLAINQALRDIEPVLRVPSLRLLDLESCEALRNFNPYGHRADLKIIVTDYISIWPDARKVIIN